MSSGQDALADPVVRRLRRFYSTNFMYAMFCHPDPLDFGMLIKQNKIILVSLEVDRAKVPPSEQQLLGALIVSQIELAARKVGKPKPVDFRLYVDEAKEFIATSLPDLFDEIRKYGVWVTIANQYLDQLKGKTLSAVMGNVTTTVAFSIGLDDASEIGQYMKPAIQPEDLLHLGVHRAAIRTILNNQAQPSFIVDTLPPPPAHTEGKARVERIKQRSIIQWTPKTRAQVLAWLEERYPRQNLNIPKGNEPNKPRHDDDDFEVAG